ncbi:MAG: ABC transporter substrate-binding protein [Marivirga sp.]|nr:ABC transporter substrate-binding protein [Marivirga sp.]
MRKFSLILTGFLVVVLSSSLAAQDLTWDEVAPGVWKAEAGKPEAYDLFIAAGIEPRLPALSQISQAQFPFEKDSIVAGLHGDNTTLRFPLKAGEQLFGFGLNFQTVYQRGRVMELHMDHYGGKDNGRTHAPVPFYVSDRGYGVFINSARYIKVWAGTGVRKDSPEAPRPLDRNTDKQWTSRPYSDAVEISVPAPGVEIYVFGGPTMLDAVRRYILYSGGGCLPPRWGLGFSHRVPRLFDAAQTIAEAEEFSQKGFPLDVIGLEPGWQSKSYPCTFTWDKQRFPDPVRFVNQLGEMNIKVNLWTNPYVSPESPVYKSILPHTGSHTVWGGVVPDVTLPEVVDLFSNLFRKEHISIGVSGYKIDETDGYDHYLWPDVATFPSGLGADQIRQTYGMLWQKLTAGLYHDGNTRTYGLTRATNGGGASLPFVLYNDYYSHEDFITALCNSGFTGALWTPEVRSSKTAEEWLRRMQSVCFSPMAMLNAWASGTKPWSFAEVEEQVKETAMLRMRLMPYFYTAFARYYFEGIPPFRAMNLEEGFSSNAKRESNTAGLNDDPYSDATVKEIKDQYMAGDFLLVAPMFSGQTSRKVILPKGKWYDFYTGKFAGEGEVISVTPGLDKIPVYVKDGGIVPMMEPRLHAPGKNEKYNLEIRHYGTKAATYKLYDDDGVSFDYERGIYSWRDIKVFPLKNGQLKGTVSKAEKNKPDNIAQVAWKFMSNE